MHFRKGSLFGCFGGIWVFFGFGVLWDIWCLWVFGCFVVFECFGYLAGFGVFWNICVFLGYLDVLGCFGCFKLVSPKRLGWSFHLVLICLMDTDTQNNTMFGLQT